MVSSQSAATTLSGQPSAGQPFLARRVELTVWLINDRALQLDIDGQDRQVVIERVMTDPIRQVKKAEARYYDADLGAWRRMVDDGLRIELARAVVCGE